MSRPSRRTAAFAAAAAASAFLLPATAGAAQMSNTETCYNAGTSEKAFYSETDAKAPKDEGDVGVVLPDDGTQVIDPGADLCSVAVDCTPGSDPTDADDDPTEVIVLPYPDADEGGTGPVVAPAPDINDPGGDIQDPGDEPGDETGPGDGGDTATPPPTETDETPEPENPLANLIGSLELPFGS